MCWGLYKRLKLGSMINVYLTRRTESRGPLKGLVKTLVFKKDENGKMKETAFCVFPASQTQPHGNLKTITLNCFNYRVKWFGKKLR